MRIRLLDAGTGESMKLYVNGVPYSPAVDGSCLIEVFTGMNGAMLYSDTKPDILSGMRCRAVRGHVQVMQPRVYNLDSNNPEVANVWHVLSNNCKQFDLSEDKIRSMIEHLSDSLVATGGSYVFHFHVFNDKKVFFVTVEQDQNYGGVPDSSDDNET